MKNDVNTELSFPCVFRGGKLKKVKLPLPLPRRFRAFLCILEGVFILVSDQ